MRRRQVLGSLPAVPWAVSGFVGGRVWAQDEAFTHETVPARAQQLATEPFVPPPTYSEEVLPPLDYSTYVGIRYDPEAALWGEADLPFRARFFHPGLFYRQPVEIFVVEDGVVRRLALNPDNFIFEDPTVRERIGRIDDFAGFNLYYHTNWQRDVASFLGASYFRAVGASLQFGKSARGIAVDTTQFGAEEFPVFRSFWLERPAPGAAEVVVHALLDGPSLAGAYRIVIRPGRTTEMDVTASLFTRRPITDVGFAPITSMYLVGENDPLRRRSIARPEAHDSDGLALWLGTGEWAWRPLVNPDHPQVSVFGDRGTRGFGLLQRDRDPNHYRDVGADYEWRPNLWVEPLGDWGEGSVVLVELPTDDEVFDNIVAYWRPSEPLAAGARRDLHYRLFWGATMPERLERPASVVATFTGVGGRPGARNDTTKFFVEFEGGILPMLERDGPPPEAVVTPSRGRVLVHEVLAMPGRPAWRLEFDLDVEGEDTVDLRAFLRRGESALTETWIYRFEPRDA